MFFTPAQIVKSIRKLSVVHPFHGITFLVCKKANLPVGESRVFPLDAETDQFLRKHHRLDPGSDWFFQPFKSSDASKKWVRPDYSAKGLQAVNTQTFGPAFLHEHNSRVWGWATNYVDFLQRRLPRKSKVPTFDLAVWLFRSFDWPSDVTASDVTAHFFSQFSITHDEKDALFDSTIPPKVFFNETLQESKADWRDLRTLLPSAPDAKPDQGGTLVYLETRGLGPANAFIFEPATRLSLITGDNGLGKSFLLEAAWWALTGTWAERPAYPSPAQRKSRVEITFAIEGEQSRDQKRMISFDWKSLSWPQPKNRPTIPGLIVYARVDGSFAVRSQPHPSSGSYSMAPISTCFPSLRGAPV